MAEALTYGEALEKAKTVTHPEGWPLLPEFNTYGMRSRVSRMSRLWVFTGYYYKPGNSPGEITLQRIDTPLGQVKQ